MAANVCRHFINKLMWIDIVPVSIKDIAKEAGVSPSTVSRALNDHPHIRDETKAAIRKLAKAMGYVPSVLARGLLM